MRRWSVIVEVVEGEEERGDEERGLRGKISGGRDKSCCWEMKVSRDRGSEMAAFDDRDESGMRGEAERLGEF